MLQFTSHLTIYLIIASGFIVLIAGDWKKLKLKFAAVLLSLITTSWFAILMLVEAPPQCQGTDLFCFTLSLYVIARNFCIALFHVAVGRDAMRMRQCDRRKSNKREMRIVA